MTANAGLGARIRDALPVTLDEDAGAYDGPFSTYKEHHSFYVGLGAGFSGSRELMVLVAGWALRGVPERKPSHIRQVAMEPAYALAGIVVGAGLRAWKALGGMLP